MSVTIFLAVCVLGFDVLIYFLYEWAFGESERIRRRHQPTRRHLWDAIPAATHAAAKPQLVSNIPARAGKRVIKMKPSAASSRRAQNCDERFVYQRLAAASVVNLKPRF